MRRLLRPLLAGLLGIAAVSAAGDSGAPPPAPPQPPAPATQAAPEQDVEDFVPTERLSADEAVSFPTDI